MAEHFFIAGAQRSATTYLYRMLEQHPDITLAQPVRPEPKYFIRDGFSGDLEAYHREFFDQAGTPWFGEKSTSYIEHPVAAERIARCLPDAVIFFMLRDPVERALSNYRFSVMNGLESLPLAQALDASRGSCPYSADITKRRAVNGTSTRRVSIQRSGGWCEPERRRRGNGPGSLRTEQRSGVGRGRQ